MREWEKASWEAGRKEREVIAEVGRLLARHILDLTAPGAEVLILAGKGHNGDDARLAEPHLRDRKVTVQRVTDPAPGLAGLQQWCRERPCRTVPTRCLIAGANLPVLVIDGLFGIGLNRPLDDAWIGLLRAINESRLPLLSVDVPSGLNGETGQAEGEAVRADLTVTLGAPKAGLIRPSAWEYVNRLEVLPEIGLIPCPFDSEICWTLPEDFAGFPPRRRAGTHKGSYGHVVIFAGSPGYHGAAVLAARAAARARPGLVTFVTSQAT
jgi:NAD(P)H-hydrate epimerase